MINESPEAQDTIPTPAALRLAHLFGTSERFWINLRTDIEIRRCKPEMESEPAAVRPHRTPRLIQLGNLCEGDLKPPRGFRERRPEFLTGASPEPPRQPPGRGRPERIALSIPHRSGGSPAGA